MKQVRIYTQTNIRGVKPANGAAGYVLEMDINGQVKNRAHFVVVRMATVQRAELKVLIEALKKVSETNESYQLIIYTESSYVAAGFVRGWIEQWAKNNWQTARNRPVANREEWIQLIKLLKRHRFRFVVGEHPYSRHLHEQLADVAGGRAFTPLTGILYHT